MAEWNGSLRLTADSIEALDSFIHHPDMRKGDIFQQGVLEVNDHEHIDWIIKHDLFEGVVMHLSLMGDDGTRFLAGDGMVLQEAEDALRTFAVEHNGTAYHVSVTEDR